MGVINLLKSFLQNTRNTVLNAVFPRFCVFCEIEGSLVCGECTDRIPVKAKPSCPVCDKKGSFTVCTECKNKTPLTGVVSLFEYGDPAVRRLIEAWKYVGDKDAAIIVQKWVALGIDKTLIRSGVVTCVPLHVNKKRARGFDQAAQLSKWVAKAVGISAVCFLERTKYTEPQAQKDKTERSVGDWDGVFKVCVEPKKGENIFVCDDVYTTGTTLSAAAQKLVDVGSGEIWGFTLARG